MANYTAVLVDHVQGHATFKGGISRLAQQRFDEAFQGTNDKVMVSWGAGAATDNLVVHFVMDVSSSYLKQKFPAAVIDPAAGGHTYSVGALSCSEIYAKANGHGQSTRQLAVAVFHEALHNLLPGWTIKEMHNLDGGGAAAGMAADRYDYNSTMTQHNKELIGVGSRSEIRNSCSRFALAKVTS